MNFWRYKWFRWIATPFAAAIGYVLGYLAWSAVDGAVAYLKFLPGVGLITWLAAGIQLYWSGMWATRFAVNCSPGHQRNVRQLVLIVVLLLQLLQMCTYPALAKRGQEALYWFYAAESCFVLYLLFKKA